MMMFMALIDAEPDKLRFERIYYNYHKQMLVVAERILHDRGEAEDAVQNALFSIARNIQTVPQHEKVERAYVLTAAKNAALSLLPQKQQRDNILDISELNTAADDSVFRQVVYCQDYHLLLHCIRQMESPYREVLMLVYVQEQELEAAAEILCRKPETVRKQLHRGRKILIELCRKEGMSFAEDRIDAI